MIVLRATLVRSLPRIPCICCTCGPEVQPLHLRRDLSGPQLLVVHFCSCSSDVRCKSCSFLAPRLSRVTAHLLPEGWHAKDGSYSSRRLISPTPPWTSRLIVCGDLP